MSNSSDNWTDFKRARHLIAMAARTLFDNPMPQYLNAITIVTNQAIANTGATSTFIMAGADVDNKHLAVKPLTINLLDEKQIQSTQAKTAQLHYQLMLIGLRNLMLQLALKIPKNINNWLLNANQIQGMCW
jgi:hypothetical protein